MSHWVEAGSGTPRSPCRPSRRLNGSPLPYFNSPIMLPAVASYFAVARLCGRGRGEDLAAQVAAQLLQLVDRRRQRRLPGDPHQHARGLLVDGALTAGGTRVAGGERRVRHVDPLGTPVSLGAVAPVTLGGRRRVRFVGVPVAGSRLGPGRGVSAATAASGFLVFCPTTASVFSVRAPKNSWRSRRIEVFLSSTRSVT